MIAKAPFSFTELVEGSSHPGQADGQEGDPALRTTPIAYCSRLSDFNTVDPYSDRKTMPAPRYTEYDLAQAVEEAKRFTASEVEAAVRTELADDIERHRCALLSSLRDQIEWHKTAFERELNRSTAISYRLAQAIAKAVIPKAIEKQPLTDISELVKAAMIRLVKEPSIELRLSPALVDDGAAVLADLAKNVGYAGVVTVTADPTLALGDARIRWKGGTINRSLGELQQEAVRLAGDWMQNMPEATTEDIGESSSIPADVVEEKQMAQEAIDPGPADEWATL